MQPMRRSNAYLVWPISLFGFGTTVYFLSGSPARVPPPAERPPPRVAVTEPKYFTAAGLLADTEGLKSERVRVTGRVQWVDNTESGTGLAVGLKADRMVRCLLDDGADVARLRKGVEVTLEGECSAPQGAVPVLAHCRIVGPVLKPFRPPPQDGDF